MWIGAGWPKDGGSEGSWRFTPLVAALPCCVQPTELNPPAQPFIARSPTRYCLGPGSTESACPSSEGLTRPRRGVVPCSGPACCRCCSSAAKAANRELSADTTRSRLHTAGPHAASCGGWMANGRAVRLLGGTCHTASAWCHRLVNNYGPVRPAALQSHLLPEDGAAPQALRNGVQEAVVLVMAAIARCRAQPDRRAADAQLLRQSRDVQL